MINYHWNLNEQKGVPTFQGLKIVLMNTFDLIMSV